MDGSSYEEGRQESVSVSVRKHVFVSFWKKKYKTEKVFLSCQCV